MMKIMPRIPQGKEHLSIEYKNCAIFSKMEPMNLHLSSNGTHNSAHISKSDTHNSALFRKKVPLNNSTSPYPKPTKLPPPPRCQQLCFNLLKKTGQYINMRERTALIWKGQQKHKKMENYKYRTIEQNLEGVR